MSEIDTGEVRRWAHTFSDKTEAIKNLCDALDEARAERNEWRRSCTELRSEMEEWDFDAEVSQMRTRAEKAEAKVTRIETMIGRTKCVRLHGAGECWPCDALAALDGPS